jgi:hypothetical protein
MVMVMYDHIVNRNSVKSKPEEASLSQLAIAQMLGWFDDTDVDIVQDIFAEQIEEGEKHMNTLYKQLSPDFLRGKNPNVEEFRNNLEYLQFLYKERPRDIVDKEIKGLTGERASLVKGYYRILTSTRKKSRDNGFMKWLKSRHSFMEAAYTRARGKPAALLLGRRKDTERAWEKIAYRLLKHEVASANSEEYSERVAIDDWFGIKLVGYKEDTIHNTIFNPLFLNLETRYGLKMDEHQEDQVTKDGIVLPFKQPAGIDDMYMFGNSPNRLIQMKVHPLYKNPTDCERPRLREIDITDVVNMLIAEMEHFQYRHRQIQKRSAFLKKYGLEDEYRKRIERASVLDKKCPEKRRRIFVKHFENRPEFKDAA